MKKFCLLFLTLVLSLDMSSKSMAELWQTMPDSVIPYIDRAQRQEMMEFISMGVEGKVRHSLQGQSKMDTLSSDYIHLTLSESMEMEMKRLPFQDGDSILCVVKTWSAPCRESEVYFYAQDWQDIEIPNPLVRYRDEVQLSRPDTMSVETFKELSHQVGFVLTAASLSVSDDTLRVYQSVPLLSKEDSEKLKPMLTTVSMKWNGRRFE
jgi:hypothetical protein